MSRNPILFWTRSGISHCYESVSKADCNAVKAKSLEVQKIVTFPEEELYSPANIEGWYLIFPDAFHQKDVTDR